MQKQGRNKREKVRGEQGRRRRNDEKIEEREEVKLKMVTNGIRKGREGTGGRGVE